MASAMTFWSSSGVGSPVMRHWLKRCTTAEGNFWAISTSSNMAAPRLVSASPDMAKITRSTQVNVAVWEPISAQVLLVQFCPKIKSNLIVLKHCSMVGKTTSSTLQSALGYSLAALFACENVSDVWCFRKKCHRPHHSIYGGPTAFPRDSKSRTKAAVLYRRGCTGASLLSIQRETWMNCSSELACREEHGFHRTMKLGEQEVTSFTCSWKHGHSCTMSVLSFSNLYTLWQRRPIEIQSGGYARDLASMAFQGSRNAPTGGKKEKQELVDWGCLTSSSC